MKKRGKRIRINLNRVKTSVLFMVAFVVCLNLGLKVTAANFTEMKNSPAYVEITVKSGDSLWNLTEIHYKGNEDIRKIIYRVKEINQLENARIVPGQLIKIPQV